jgi:hypothetical protein
MSKPLAQTLIIDVRVERSARPMRCDECGNRRVLYTLILEPLEIPSRWRCGWCTGLRVEAVSGLPSASPSDLEGTLWSPKIEDFRAGIESGDPLLREARASVALDHDPDEGTHSVGDGHDHGE